MQRRQDIVVNWPKTVGFLAGWGFGSATLNGKPLYRNYEMHFMVDRGRDLILPERIQGHVHRSLSRASVMWSTRAVGVA